MESLTLLIAEINDPLGRVLKGQLVDQGFQVILTSAKTPIRQILGKRKPNLVVLVSCGEAVNDGFQVAEEIRRRDQEIPMIMVTKFSSEPRVIGAMRVGFNDYLKVPFSRDEFLVAVKNQLPPDSDLSLHQRVGVPGKGDPPSMIGNSLLMRELREYLPRVAATDSTVLITGESGTGKELAADLIYRESNRSTKPFVCINCAALPESLVESEMFGHERGAFTGAVATRRGQLEQANSGTAFLDEIGDMSLYAQAKILRAIETKKIQRLAGKESIPLDVRVIAATNRDPEQMVSEGKFREDLYYRLNVARVELPPLRDRKEDIPQLLDYYTRELNRKFGRNVEGFTEEALSLLLQYHWPGNVRELRNLLEAAFINLPQKEIGLMDLPKPFQCRLKASVGLPEKERDRLLSALIQTKWNKTKAARKLNWSRMTLYRKMMKYQIVRSHPEQTEA